MSPRAKRADDPSGLLLVDKPAGVTSAGVVARVRRVLGGVKAGHVGTLDPFATGLLPLCLGEGTKLATYLTEADKTYEGVIRLGIATDTDDATGQVLQTAQVGPLDATAVSALSADLTGVIGQVPPAYSAIKRGGRPMYELARRGETVELDARPVTIHRLELGIVGAERLRVSIDCSKGFYVRALARDIGQRLGCGAMLESLRRTRVGTLRIEDAVALAEIMEEPGGADRARQAVIPMLDALRHLRKVSVGADDAADLRLGRQRALVRLGTADLAGERVCVAVGEELVAVAVAKDRSWQLERVFGVAGA
ncbi:MAG: tRNA pseudouridine(55) synthase TruB [Deltaproteobacteria bacterium]|nr:tRNA pseudouridine(55) synthase TruB [Deltaproteobacteria bacterium]